MWLNENGRTKNFYFIGIGGISMSGLAKLLRRLGYFTAGSDLVCNEQVKRLKETGIPVHIGQRSEIAAELRGADVVVFTDAIPKDDQELLFALKAGKELLTRSALLKWVCGEFNYVTAVAGSHGKTTCTSICAHILKAARVGFAAHIGGDDATFGNFYMNGFEHFLTEACEYKKNVKEIIADRAILLNVDKDHMECYRDEADLTDTFLAFCKQAKTAIVCSDDERAARLAVRGVTFGIKDKFADYRATNLKAVAEKYSFTVTEYGNALCRVKLNAIGRCNVYNALAAFAAMRSYGISEREIVAGIESFRAVKRRFEEIGRYKNATFIADYAHHPKEIEETLKTAKRLTKKKLYVIFQPHTYSRTKLLMEDFKRVLSKLPELVIYKTYPAREKFDETGDGKTLAAEIGESLYVDKLSVLQTYLEKTVKEGDTVLILGAGDLYFAVKFLLDRLH